MNKADCNYKYERYLSELPWDFSPIMVANTLLPTRDRSSKTISMEEMVTILGTISLADTNVKFITRKDLSILLKANELGNLPTDIAWLRKQTDNKTFNVYAIGWHGLYVLSTNQSEDRIYGVDTDFNLIREHTLKAYETWHKDRMGFGVNWRANNT